jgi:hypothetical protein
VLTLVRKARRRLFRNELFAQGANAASAALAAFILLLLFGTQVLNWEWLVLIPAAAAAFGFYRVRKRLPSVYRVAQQIDSRLSLADTLSTALYFTLPESRGRVSEEIRRAQLEAAERTAQTVDLRRAMPYSVPRTAYGMIALLLVASSLFALRYGLSRRLDLQQPIARMLQQNFSFGEKTEEARTNRRTPLPQDSLSQDNMDESALDREHDSGEQNGAETPADEAKDGQPVQGETKGADGAQKQAQDAKAEDGDQSGEGDEQQGQESESANQGQQGNNKPDAKQDSGAKQDANNSADNSSLLSKVKDAMQNLLSRMKPQQNQASGQQSQEQNGKQGKSQQNGSKQQASKDGQKQAGEQQGDSQDGESGEQAQNAQDQQGKGNGKNDVQQASKQPGSGVGSQDGDKSIKKAEQLAAMGKISEILGKRSANISGETTVEVQSTSQTLHTPYAQRGAQHSQGGAEINRDEIPVALQGYVEQYFEQVRKQPAAPARK